MFKLLAILVVATILKDAEGHGRMLVPPSRSSVWRFYPGFPANYNDAGLYCGGYDFIVAQGMRCGLCGDPYPDAIPRENENTGKYGLGKIVGEYTAGEVIDISVEMTVTHYGTFEFHLCELKDANAPEPDEDCFKPLLFEDGSPTFTIPRENGFVDVRVKLPDGFSCERCVLRWHYRAANRWGDCGDGTSAMGCGNQQIFRNCADITIR